GLNASYALWSLALSFGMGAFMQQYPAAFYYVQIAGCVYIFYLAASFFGKKAASGGGARKLKFWDGVVSQALNVKGVSIAALMYSQFLSADSPALPQVLKLTAMLALLNIFTHMTWAMGGSWMVSRLASERATKIQNKIYAAMLFAVAVWLLPFP
ncbi:MAG: LysE family transporter, partial [Betaproteobacteria bacterium]|nr:LysE family transporter [Betaproteobacteria bacterium]